MNEHDILLFDRRAVRWHRDRAAAVIDAHDFLIREIGDRMLERVFDVKRGFGLALDLNAGPGLMGRALAGAGRIKGLVSADLSAAMVARASGIGIVADEEALPFRAASFDLVTSVLGLHWVNDLPGSLVQIRRALVPDGLFLAALFGGETLRELRHALLLAETEITGGASPRVSPAAALRDVGALLQRAGFALPVTDVDTITVRYPDPFALMRDLRGMGEANATCGRPRGATRRAVFARAAEIYAEEFADAEGRVPATFQVLFLTGWAPHESQQKPLRPGSANARLADALGTDERSAGEVAGTPAKSTPSRENP
ncbi:methyltransferase domain-containing protein [Oceanibacterium hippocampi]|uniref:Malonyl-[acyl-carrier protein] O-methyltransferase n=1 Tax=Oceanibacterium hippocampi TaxID=745714 RepID=A0A1Y5R6A2_9PROT|nr:methyltransferase domain-containing protein [Oceanibacterium hippocampi]SLN10179.1 Malonyl-[acyl-carrier protein] O-methyltransferase [Oceanibacterium hippocampi]